MQKINTRKISFQILKKIENSGQISDRVINDNFKNKDLDKRDENLVRKIVYGCLENQILLDYYIRRISSIRFSKIDSDILIILRIGLYQIKFYKIPALCFHLSLLRYLLSIKNYIRINSCKFTYCIC
ncbi:transcription antitermination factor NusB [Clostridiaceae bacterium HSG29]|nr:transcription antitermination factor NusB [Clostridiaceae bacterium HSG29]